MRRPVPMASERRLILVASIASAAHVEHGPPATEQLGQEPNAIVGQIARVIEQDHLGAGHRTGFQVCRIEANELGRGLFP